jgi:hypothetical protein
MTTRTENQILTILISTVQYISIKSAMTCVTTHSEPEDGLL